MSRTGSLRDVLLRTAASITAALFALPVAAQESIYDTEVTARHVAGSVHMLTGFGGNVGVSAGEDGILMVDTQHHFMSKKIREAVEGISPGAIRFVVNTCYHSYNTAGNALVDKDALIVAHRNMRKRLLDPPPRPVPKARVRSPASPSSEKFETVGGQPPNTDHFGPGGRARWIADGSGFTQVRRKRPKYPRGRLKDRVPDRTYEDSLSIEFNGEEIIIGHLGAGHTDGDSFVHFSASNVIHLGNQFAPGRFPAVDLAGGGNVVGLRDSIGRLLKRLPADAKVIPSFGPLSSVEDLKSYHRMLEECIAAVKTEKDAGKGLGEIQAVGLPAEWAGWATRHRNESDFIRTMYESL